MYQNFACDISPLQLKRLAKGDRIRLKNDQLGHGMGLDLTATQVKACEKAMRLGKGVQLGFSDAQIEHHMKVGDGRFSDFFKNVGSKIKSGAVSVAQNLAPMLIDKAASIGTALVKDKVRNSEYVPDLARGVLESALSDGIKYGNSRGKDELANFLGGLMQTKNGGALFVKNGEGLFDFIPGGVGKFLNKVGNTALSVAVPVAQGALMRRLGGGVRANARGGKGLYLAGEL